MPLLKSLVNEHNEPPMEPPKGFDPEDEYQPDDLDDRSSVSSFDNELFPKSLPSQPPNTNQLTQQLPGPIHREASLPSSVTSRLGFPPSQAITVQLDPNTTYGQGAPGIPVRVLILGAAINAVPGTQIASSVHTAVTSTAKKASSVVRKVSHLSKSFMGMRNTTDISHGWVELDDDEIQDIAVSETS